MVLLSDVWRDETPSFPKNERMETMHSRCVLADPNSPIAVCEKKVWLARVSFQGFPQFFGMSMFSFVLVCFVSLFRVTWKY